MKNKSVSVVRLLLILFSVTIVVPLMESCTKELEVHVNPVESLGQDGVAVKDYLSKLKKSTDNDGKNIISKVEENINFANLKKYQTNVGESIIIADIKNSEAIIGNSESAKAVFLEKENVIISSNIYGFSNPSERDNDIVKNIVTTSFTGEGYNGRISVYAISGKLIYFNEARNGKIIKGGYAQPRVESYTPSVKGARPSQCIAWYLITTENGVVTSTQYLYTVCDCEQNARVGVQSETGAARLSCGGGSGGGGGTGPGYTSPPNNPKNGDEWTLREPDGKIVRYRAVDNVWTIISVTLPIQTVQTNPTTYPFLVSDSQPDGGTVIFGPDTFMYVYSTWSGAWFAAEPYAYSYVVTGPDKPINLPQKLKNCFGNVSADGKYQYSVTMYVDQPKYNSRDKIHAGDRAVGHTYLGFSQYDQTTQNTVTVVGGFYSSSNTSAVLSSYGGGTTGTWGDDGGSNYDVAIKVDMNSDQFRDIINNLYNSYPQSAPTYNLANYNCTTFARTLLAPYVSLPSGTGYLPALGSGVNPADMAEDLRGMAGAYNGKATFGDNLKSPSTNCN